MNYLKKTGKSFLYIIGILLVGTFLVTSLNFLGIFGPKWMMFFKIAIPVISLFVGGFIIGKNSSEKGWLEGLKLGLIFITILLLFNYLGLNYHFEWKIVIFILILLTSSIFGSMIGINKKIEQQKN